MSLVISLSSRTRNIRLLMKISPEIWKEQAILIYRLSYFLKIIFAGPRYRFRLQEIRYQFQWYAKKMNSRRYPASDMTEMVHKASRTGQIKVVFRDLIRSDRAFIRQGRNSWKLSWMDGMLTDTRNGKELFAFHFVDSKTDPEYTVEPMEDHTDKFTITERGIDCLLHEKTGK